MFDKGNLLITGGTGSFGNAVLEGFIKSSIEEVRIFSRDEKKQDDMRKKFNNKKIKFYLGDVRDRNSLNQAMKDVNYVFHAAALKQVPSCEFYPMEAIKTNIIGTENVLETSLSNKVSKVVCLSTDKAVYPINTMGLSKALMEKVMTAFSRNAKNNETIFCATRYGNVMASRGSVIPLFIDQIKNNRPITITNPEMTRFMMTLTEAVDLVDFAFRNGKNGDIFIQKSPSADIVTLAKAISEIMDKPNHPIDIIGTRHGEKIFETLLSKEEKANSDDLGTYFRINPDVRDLNYSKFIENGQLKNPPEDKKYEFNSHNTKKLNKEELKAKLLGIEIIKKELKSK